jgi:RecB family exonuclease
MGRPSAGYYNSAGEKLSGVTTIIGRFKDSGGLIQWAYKSGREHERLVAQGKEAPRHLYDVTAAACAAGTIAHDMIEADILGAEFKPPQADAAILTSAGNAFAQFREWRSQSSIEILTTEKAYVSEKHQFGGTVDAIGRDAKGRIVLLDWKTSNAVYSDMLIQLAAYAMLLEECAPEWTPTGFHLLRVAKESADFSHHYFGELEDAKKQFLLFRGAYDLDKIIRKRAA